MTRRRRWTIAALIVVPSLAGLGLVVWKELDERQLRLYAAGAHAEERAAERSRLAARTRDRLLAAVHFDDAPAAVREAIGSPDSTQEHHTAGGVTEIWYYLAVDGRVQLVFEGGALKSKNAY